MNAPQAAAPDLKPQTPSRNWRAWSVGYLLVALAMFALCVRAAHQQQHWAPWCVAGIVFLALGARKPRKQISAH